MTLFRDCTEPEETRPMITKVIRQSLGLLIRSLYVQHSYRSNEIAGLDSAGVDIDRQDNEGLDSG